MPESRLHAVKRHHRFERRLGETLRGRQEVESVRVPVAGPVEIGEDRDFGRQTAARARQVRRDPIEDRVSVLPERRELRLQLQSQPALAKQQAETPRHHQGEAERHHGLGDRETRGGAGVPPRTPPGGCRRAGGG